MLVITEISWDYHIEAKELEFEVLKSWFVSQLHALHCMHSTGVGVHGCMLGGRSNMHMMHLQLRLHRLLQ